MSRFLSSVQAVTFVVLLGGAGCRSEVEPFHVLVRQYGLGFGACFEHRITRDEITVSRCGMNRELLVIQLTPDQAETLRHQWRQVYRAKLGEYYSDPDIFDGTALQLSLRFDLDSAPRSITLQNCRLDLISKATTTILNVEQGAEPDSSDAYDSLRSATASDVKPCRIP